MSNSTIFVNHHSDTQLFNNNFYEPILMLILILSLVVEQMQFMDLLHLLHELENKCSKIGEIEDLSSNHFAYMDSIYSTLVVDKKLFWNFASSKTAWGKESKRLVVEMILFITIFIDLYLIFFLSCSENSTKNDALINKHFIRFMIVRFFSFL